MGKRIFFSFLFFTMAVYAIAQPTFPKDEPKYNKPGVYALTNATIHVSANKVIEGATLLIEKEKIIDAGKGISIPKNAVTIDLKGKHIYPSFIDLYSSYGMPAIQRETGDDGRQYENNKKGATHWNECVHPETNAIELFKTDANSAKELRNIGFGTVNSIYADGLMRGTSALVTLGEDKENLNIIRQKAANNLSFRKGSSRQAYPSSLTGNIALLRQTYYDKAWYEAGGSKKEFNPSLQALGENNALINIFETGDKLSVLRAAKIAAEFNLKCIYKTNGTDYQRINDIKAAGGSLIIPVNFPEAFDVEDYYDAQNVTLAELKHWEQAPGNALAIYKAGIPFTFTLDGLREKGSFLANIKKAITYGLPEAEAIKALTETPANLMGVAEWVGTLEKSKLANFIITNEPLFTEKCVIQENWVKGRRFEIKPIEQLDIRGEYSLNINQTMYTLSVKGDITNPSAEIKSDTIKVTGTLKKDVNTIGLGFVAKDRVNNGPVRLSGTINFDSGSWDGNGQLPDGSLISWTAIRKDKFKEEKKKPIVPDSVIVGKTYFPNMAYGWDSIPQAEMVFIKNATVWTNEADGIIRNADVILKDGKIVQVGKNLPKPFGKIIEVDGTNKHVTSGIIDEHSHIALSQGVNEGGQSVSAEVRMGDVVNSDDINIYRQLSGGVTAAQLLHGSANPVGGQSAIIKLRWGMTPEEMKIKGADGFIKFALGENVKQSNWGDPTGRYPQTRMGVEQVFYDAFFRAKAYESEWKDFTDKLTKSKGIKPDAPRKDLEAETMLEILQGKRFITCHSYVQSEINMLMHVADSMGFKINTFTHILEGYKVADKMKAHGANASSFSDWWAYKFEVYDAIPYNAAIMTKVGVNTAINSDDAEMARRLNQEAAKSVKYGGMSEEDAWKMVTLNPAKMLHLDKQMGSLKTGKDADVVVWGDNPLSIYAKVEKTFVDGILYYDLERDVTLDKRNTAEKLRLIRKMMEAKASGEKTVKPTRKTNKQYHCDTIGEEMEEDHN
ncbi:MAG TPA: amidohydrolase family protein [Flavobacteriales bacterium]|nr:amidohydrolase family protein [Flavobacteriales bacterium]